MIRWYCDRCGVENSEASPLDNYQLTAKMEAKEEKDDDDRDYAIEFEAMEVCQPCTKEIVAACRAFVKEQRGIRRTPQSGEVNHG